MITLIDWSSLELLKKMYEWEEILRILKGGEGNWIIIPSGNERPFSGTAYAGERGVQRAGRFFLN